MSDRAKLEVEVLKVLDQCYGKPKGKKHDPMTVAWLADWAERREREAVAPVAGAMQAAEAKLAEEGKVKQQLAAEREAHAKTREEVKFHHASLVRVAEAVGVTEPLQLIALAENNDETYVDLLIKHIAAEREKVKALREDAEYASKMKRACREWSEQRIRELEGAAVSKPLKELLHEGSIGDIERIRNDMDVNEMARRLRLLDDEVRNANLTNRTATEWAMKLGRILDGGEP